MPLYVCALAADEIEQLTLGEWDELLARREVAFEDPAHPLMERLRSSGADVLPLEGDADAASAGALVARPSSPRIIELAQAGAVVSSGPSWVPDALTAARGAYVARRARAAVGSLASVMARLRGADGCPWDAEQTHASLQPHLLEETHEVLEAIDDGKLGYELEEELGDLLLQVLFHSQMAADDGRFDVAGVASGIVSKLVRRHPHVFGDVEVGGADDVVANWEAIKQEEKQRNDPFEGIPPGLPALAAAYKTQKRAAGRGFRPDPEQARARASEALEGGPEAVGRALFWTVAVARAGGVDPEAALRKATKEFQKNA